MSAASAGPSRTTAGPDRDDAPPWPEPATPPGLSREPQNGPDDAYLGCLQFFARQFERPTSHTVLTAGLPLEEGRLTPALFARAARRIGLATRTLVRPLDSLAGVDLPALVRLQDGRPVVLVAVDRDGICDVLVPETQGVVRTPRAALAEITSGEVVLVSRYYRGPEEAGRAEAMEGHWFWRPLAARWPDLAAVGVAAFVINVIGLAAPLFTMNIYDRVLPNKAFATLWVLALGFLAVLVFDLVLRVARAALLDRVGKGLDIELSEALFEKILNTPLSSRPGSTGEFVNRVAQYEFVRDFFTAGTLTLFVDCAFLFVYLIVIFALAGWIVVIPLIAMLGVVAVGLLAQRLIGDRMATMQAEGSLRHAMLVEAISALETVKTIRAEGILLRRWDRLIQAASLTQERIKSISATTVNMSLFLQQTVTIGIVACGAYRFAAGEMSTGAIIATVMLASRAVAPLSALAGTLARTRHALSALRTLDAVMNLPDERVGARSFIDRPVTQGSIKIRNGAFAYPQVERMVLTDVSLSVRPGEKIGILGRVGSGKTTLGRLIAGLYPLTQGELLLDGVDIRQIHPHEVRRAVSIVSQDADLFIGTLRENILVAKPDASDGEIVEASRLAGVDDFAAQHPMGYDMPVGERGRLLSTGQRQAVALARAFLIRPRILFLDEPSSSMDFATERTFLQRLSASMPADQTVLVATHRFSLLALVDRLLVVENGRLVADGPKDAVLAALKQASGTG